MIARVHLSRAHQRRAHAETRVDLRELGAVTVEPRAEVSGEQARDAPLQHLRDDATLVFGVAMVGRDQHRLAVVRRRIDRPAIT